MQKITVKEVRGPLGKGEKKFFAVVDEQGAEFTTFDTKVKDITPGSVLEIEPEVKGRFVNIKEFKVISEGTPKPTSANGGYKRDLEGLTHEYKLKAKLQAIERASIEAQTAYNKIMDAFIADRLGIKSSEVVDALEWAKSRLRVSIKPPEAKPEEKKSEEAIAPEEIFPEEPFPNVGKLLSWCMDNGVDRKAFMEIVGCTEKDISKVNISDAYELVKQEIEKRKAK